MKGRTGLHFQVIICVMAVLLFSLTASAETCKQWFAKVVSVQGKVQVKNMEDGKWVSVKLNDLLCSGDVIRVTERSRAVLMLGNEQTLRLDQNTLVTLSGYEKENTSVLDILSGVVHFFSRHRQSLKITTPYVNATVEGTEFLVKAEKDHTIISIFEGQVLASNTAGNLMLNKGQSAVVFKDKAPELKMIVHPRDAVQWALYYPPVMNYRPTDFQGKKASDWQTMVGKSIEFWSKGNMTAAYESLGKAPKNIRDPRFFTYRASLLLSVGRIDEADDDINKALKLDPNDSSALSLQSVIAVVQNEKEKAISLAQKAVAADNKSASASIALSYAQQSNFDLQGSLESLKKAVAAEPENALAWSRLSELYLSFGRLCDASHAADKAEALNPDLSRTQTVLGFARLSETKTVKAKAAFEKSIQLDQADPLPRFGLGLAIIREGRLDQGKAEIEIAVSLDPDNALLRSYLGKAFYEEKRNEKAEQQFIIAEELDPKDPTPYLYDAIRKQTENRPVEALQDIQKSIELNDNRAVYRSRQLLDADLAARSASLARVYSDLGFDQLALVEGWKSVNTDPADFSAHRFLSDSYSALPRHGIARVSELLQAQLLQPINITPLQPHLEESNLSILSGAGPSELSFNEYNQLFNRNRYSLQVSGLAGSGSTFGNELVVSGVQGNVSFSAGQFHYETDGFRKNDDQKQDIYNIFAQVSLSPKTSVQAEFRSRDFDRGDLMLLFNPDDFDRDLRQADRIRSVRLGLHHSFSPNSDFIASLIYQTSDLDFRITDEHSVNEENGTLTEVQHLYRTGQFSLISGAGYFDKDLNYTDTYQGQAYKLETSPHQANLYLYTQVHYLKDVEMTIGASADFFKGQFAQQTLKRDQFNPKLGLTWIPVSGTTLRTAIFRTLQRSLLTDQTIEPTQVSGFNQFFDDAEGTRAWRYGIGVDQKISSQIYGGAELTIRDLKVPGVTFNEETFILDLVEADWKEKLARAYLYWTPNSRMALSTEYQFERLERPREFAVEKITRLNTHRVLFGIGFFGPCGFSGRINPTYIAQNGKFVEGPSFDQKIVSKDDQFWIFDASVSYRLPKRTGILTLEGRNLFDQKINFQDTDPSNPSIYSKRLILAKFSLTF
jgi:tetratricopeptide (TPR) repeat protein